MRVLSLLIAIAASVAQAQSPVWTVGTLAGTTRPVNDGGPGTAAFLNNPGSVVIDSANNVIFADAGNHRVRRIDANGVITTIAGAGTPGYSGDGGPALSAQFLAPQGLAFDSKGNLYVADYDACVVRMIDSSGTISTVVGNGFAGKGGDGGAAQSANLNGPFALAFDKSDTLYIADTLNNTIRRVTPAGIISTFTPYGAGYPEGLAVDANGTLYVSAFGDNKIYKSSSTGILTVIAGSGAGFAGDGASAVFASMSGPRGIAVDSSGTLWICDSLNNRIRTITNGTIQTVIGSGVAGLSGLNAPAMSIALYGPSGIAIDTKGSVYWTEAGNQRIRKYPPNGFVADLAGATPPLNTGGAASMPLLFNPAGVTTDAGGNLYIADTANHVVRKIAPGGLSSIVAGTGQANFIGANGPATALNLVSPVSVAVDNGGNLLIADAGSARVLRVDTSGNMTTILGGGMVLPFNCAGQSCALAYPVKLTMSPYFRGDTLVLDEGYGVVFAIGPGGAGPVPAVATSSFSQPSGIASDETAIYIADTGNNRIVEYGTTPYGGTGTFVFAGTGRAGYSGDGGPAANATFFYPSSIAVDANKNLFVVDQAGNVVRMIDPSGKITTIAGNGRPGFAGDGGLASAAEFLGITDINVDSTGAIELADQGNQRIRVLKYGQIPPDLTLNANSATQSCNHGDSVQIELTLTSVGSFTGSAEVTVNAPAGIHTQFAPAPPVTVAAGQILGVTSTIQVDFSTAPGTYPLVFTLTSGTIQHTATVTLNVTNTPQFSLAAVVSAASYAGGGVSPGEIVAIYGQDMGPASIALGSFDSSGYLSTEAGGTQVFFDRTAAPLIYSLAGQLSAIVPYEIAGQAITSITIQYNGRSSPAIAVPVVGAAPGIFTVPGGTQASALNANLSVNSANNPAAKGSVIVLFATGEGQTNPGGVDGKLAATVFPKPLLPVTVTIGGESAAVLYYGAAPSEVAGLMQLNVRIPADLPSGPATVTLQVGTAVNGGAATIAIQ